MSCRILFIEDSIEDVELMRRELLRVDFEHEHRQVSTKQDFLEALESFRPDIILADYTMPVFNGMHAFRLFKDQKLDVPFVLVTGSLNENLAMECQSEGVDDYMLKSSFKRVPEVILRNLKLKEVEKQRQKIAAELELKNEELKLLQEKSERSRAQEILSNREFEILCLLASGKTTKEIADQLFISPATVATYRARLLEKLELKSNVEITQYALRNHLIE